MKVEREPTLKEICRACGKPIPGGRQRGSLTSFLFSAAECTCALSRRQNKAQDTAFCPHCGLKIVAQVRDGSLTAFLFQSTRCKCPTAKAFDDGSMTSRFYKLKQEDAGSTFNRSAADDKTNEQSQAARINLAPDAIIGGVYEIIKMIGRGGMGEVYLARHITLGKKCALKVIPPDQVTEIGWQRFQLEAKAVAKFDHINLVRVTDLGIHEGCLPYYAMDYVDGKNLADYLAEVEQMPLQLALEIFMQVCDGVDYAHRNGILHRDLKPANVMIVPQKNGCHLVKILDFGLAKLTTHDRNKQSLTAVGDVFGSPFYMSPEQCRGIKLDRRSDVYSMGCTLFECLTGRPPFTGQVATAVMFSQMESDAPTLASVAGAGQFPNSMEIIMAKLLRKNPVERYQTFSELRNDLTKVAQGETVEPFYVKRSQTANLDEYEDEFQHEEPRPILFWPLAVSATVLVIGAIVSLQFLSKPTSYAATDAGTKARDTVRFKPMPASARDNAPYSSIEIVNGKKMRVFNFPQDIVIGILNLRKQREYVPAKGKVSIPLSEFVAFECHPSIIDYPNYIKRFRPNDISTVRVAEQIDSTSQQESRKYRTQLLELYKDLPGLKGVELICDNLPLGAEDLRQLEHYPALRSLSIQGSDQDPVLFSTLSSIGQLEEIQIATDRDVRPVLQRLNGSTNIRVLSILETDFSIEELKMIASMKNLRWLRFHDMTPRDEPTSVEGMKILATLPNLAGIAITGTNLVMTPQVIPAMKRFKNLKFFEYSDAPVVYAHVVRQNLASALPQVWINSNNSRATVRHWMEED